MMSPTCPPSNIQHLALSFEGAIYRPAAFMDIQTPEAPNAGSGSAVDASRPFRSVKEAVTIFGERLFFGDIQSSPKRTSFGAAKEEPSTSELTRSVSKPSSSMTNVKDGEPSLDEPRDTAELREPSYSSELYQSPDKSTNPAAAAEDVVLPLEEPSRESYSLEITQSSTEALSLASKLVVESPMYEITPSPQYLKNENNGNIVHGNDLVMLMMVLKKLEAELQETKAELKQLKQRGSETEVAIASLNAELHKSMSETDKAEGATKSITSNEGWNKGPEMRDEERTRGDMMVKSIDSPTLAQILSISDYEGYCKANKLRTRKLMKKKPIVPLVTDIFSWKKKSPTYDISKPFFSSQLYFA